MKIKQKPTNIYEVIVSQSRSVTYLVHAQTSEGASSKALHTWDETDIKVTDTTVHEQNVETIECVERDIYDES